MNTENDRAGREHTPQADPAAAPYGEGAERPTLRERRARLVNGGGAPPSVAPRPAEDRSGRNPDTGQASPASTGIPSDGGESGDPPANAQHPPADHLQGARAGSTSTPGRRKDAGGRSGSGPLGSQIFALARRLWGGSRRTAAHGGGEPRSRFTPPSKPRLADTGNAGRTSSGEDDSYAADLETRIKLSLSEVTLPDIARICVGSPKGGVGKSSLAYALAGSIGYYSNLRVVLVDTDPNFGATRLLVPRPVEHSVVSLAEAADEIDGLSDLRRYVARNDQLRLDVVLNPEHAYEMARFEDLGAAFKRIDGVLSRYYDLIVYDLGLGFRDPAIRTVLGLCNQLLFVSDSEIIPNAQLTDALTYVENLGVDLARTTLALNHRLPARDESAATPSVRSAHGGYLRRVAEVPYDARMSQLLNQRRFHVEDLAPQTRRGILTAVAVCLEGLRQTVDSRDTLERVVDDVPGATTTRMGGPPDGPDGL